MPKGRMKGKARGRKRKASSPLESEEIARSESQPHSTVKNTTISTTLNGGKYVPRFGSAAKKQRVDSKTKKLNRDTSEEEEQVLCPISCTQPVGSAGGDLGEGEWSSTQPGPASRLLSSTRSVNDVQEGQVTDSLTKLQHEIPSNNETKDNTGSVAVIPGLALSQSLSPSLHPACLCDNDNEEVRDSNIHATDHVKSPGEAVSSGAEERETSARSENDVDDKCLNLLNPFSLDVDEEISCTKGGECHDQSPHTNTALAAGATNPMISPTIATSTHAIDSHRNDVYNGVQGCLADTGVLPNSCLEQTIQHEPIEESFYSMSSQKKEKQTTRTKDNDSSPSQNKDIQSSPPEAGGGSPSNRSTDDEVEALKELVDLEPGDLEESQLMVSASLTGDQTAPSTHVQLTPHSAPFVAGHARRRPSSEQQSSQEMSLKEGTQIIHGLIQELSALKFILHCKRELETAFWQQRSSQHMPRHQQHHPVNLAGNFPTHTQR